MLPRPWKCGRSCSTSCGSFILADGELAPSFAASNSLGIFLLPIVEGDVTLCQFRAPFSSQSARVVASARAHCRGTDQSWRQLFSDLPFTLLQYSMVDRRPRNG